MQSMKTKEDGIQTDGAKSDNEKFKDVWMSYQGISSFSEKFVQGKIALDARSKDRMFFAANV